MDDLKDKTALVYDYGYNIGLARRLAREFGKVKYFSPWKDTEPESKKLIIGEGFEDIERVRHFYHHVSTTDIFVFPDIYDGDLQLHLESLGKRVWGSRIAERYEFDRPLFFNTLKEVGLDYPDYMIIHGVDDLDKYLQNNDNKWVKVNLRGDDETWQHINYELSRDKILAIRHRHGPIGNEIMFTVCDHIDSTIEAAYDGFMVTSPDGNPQFPEIGFLGYENKNNSHILSAIPYADFEEGIREVNTKFAPKLSQDNFRSAWGTEIKRTDDGENFFLDATCRQPSPPGEIIMEMVLNLGEFMWEGSVGNLVPLEIDEPVGVQVIFYSECSKSNWTTLQYPSELDDWFKVSRCFRDGDYTIVIPDKSPTVGPEGIERIGSMVALADTIEDAIEVVKDRCDQVQGQYLTNEFDSLAECIRRIKQGEKQGIQFGDDKIPEPSTVIEP